jgi:hypothetical protein
LIKTCGFQELGRQSRGTSVIAPREELGKQNFNGVCLFFLAGWMLQDKEELSGLQAGIKRIEDTRILRSCRDRKCLNISRLPKSKRWDFKSL